MNRALEWCYVRTALAVNFDNLSEDKITTKNCQPRPVNTGLYMEKGSKDIESEMGSGDAPP